MGNSWFRLERKVLLLDSRLRVIQILFTVLELVPIHIGGSHGTLVTVELERPTLIVVLNCMLHFRAST